MTAYIDAEIARAVLTVGEALADLDRKLAATPGVHNLYLGAVTLMTDDTVVASFWSEDAGLILSNMFTAEEQESLGKYLRYASQAAIHGKVPIVHDPDSLDNVVAKRQQKLGQVLTYDPYGPAEVPDHVRLRLVADYFQRVNAVRETENRVPEDLRRLADELESES